MIKDATITLYLERKPRLEAFGEEDFIKANKGVSNRRSYGERGIAHVKWVPQDIYKLFPNKRDSHVLVFLDREPSYYFTDRPRKELERARKNGVEIPQVLIEKTGDENVLVADKELYQILREYRGLEETLPQLQPLWWLTSYMEGKETYGVDLKPNIFEDEITDSGLILKRVVDLVRFLKDVYNGVVWVPATHIFEMPTVQDLQRLYTPIRVSPVPEEYFRQRYQARRDERRLGSLGYTVIPTDGDRNRPKFFK